MTTPAVGSGDAPARAPRRVDVRLLVPALVAWSAVAVGLGWPAGRLLLVATGAALAGVVLLARWGRLAGLSLTLLVTALTLLAASAHTAARTAGPVPQLAAERAVLIFEATVTADPTVVRRPDEQFVEQSHRRRGPLVLVRLRLDAVRARGE
ncbi:MAG TPA: hypothetical protein VFJ12_03120, partial [Segeticoccus sp.]|nr:hypothetical protein [Segeticoccus sp.]